MKKRYSLCFVSGILLSAAPAFGALNYTETNLTAAFAYNTSPTVFGELPPGIDDAYTNVYSIGFTFQYGSVLYTQFLVSSNGWLSFNTGCIGSDPANQLAGNATQTANAERPIIAPLWDDLDVDATGNVNYKLTGIAPNRILTVEWKKMRWKVSATGPTISFQVKLYESSNIIDFCYLQESAAVSAGTASIGLEGPSGTDYYSLTNTTAAPGVNHNASEVTTLNAKPASNQVYRWTNNATPLAIELLSFTGENHGLQNMLHWTTARETNNFYFTLERSTSAAFEEIAHIDGAGTSAEQNNYSYSDDPAPAGISYYRLKQTDFNGHSGWSNVIALRRDDLPADIQILPNPADQLVLIQSAPKQAAYTIISETGQIIREGKLDDQWLDVSALENGLYILRIDQTIVHKLVVHHEGR